MVLYPYLAIKDLWVSVALKELPQKMESIKLNEKLRLGRQSSLPRQS